MTQTVKAYKCQRTGKMFPTQALAQASENQLPKTKIAELKRRIAKGKFWVPKIGDVIYVRTSMSCDHGWDDVAGGLALVVNVRESMSGGNPKTPFVEVAQHSGNSYNWNTLFRTQQQEMERYGNEVAHPDPDYGPGGNQYDPHEWR